MDKAIDECGVYFGADRQEMAADPSRLPIDGSGRSRRAAGTYALFGVNDVEQT